jgi:hypothetical protein
MTIIYRDLCGSPLEHGNSGVRVPISEFKADSCDACAKKLIAHVKGLNPIKYERIIGSLANTKLTIGPS